MFILILLCISVCSLHMSLYLSIKMYNEALMDIFLASFICVETEFDQTFWLSVILLFVFVVTECKLIVYV
jgi:hypothetical protein